MIAPIPESSLQPDPQVLCLLGSQAVISSAAMREVMQRAEQAARTGAPVLITGEAGVGKALIARAVHECSARCGKPWVEMNCAALPDGLAESELFGYERGAFDGAGVARQGLLELAHSGSLFLEDIYALPPRLQVKLLRVLEGAPYCRVSGARKVAVDTRVIAAASSDLEAAVRKGAFRGDLFHRLSQVQIRVPALRGRPEDIEPLARFFLERTKPGLRLSAAAAAVLRNHDWPGNVGELRNCMIRAGAKATGGVVEPRSCCEFDGAMVDRKLRSYERESVGIS
jgi:DNA-binding NtrC family response regulator